MVGSHRAPTREDLLRFLRGRDGDVTKRDLARAFQVKGPARSELKQLLRELEAEGALARGGRRRFHSKDQLPGVGVVEVVAIDADGELAARPVGFAVDEAPAIAVVAERRRALPALGIGDRVLARLTRVADGTYEARPIKVLARRPERVVGRLVRAGKQLQVHPLGPKGGDVVEVVDDADLGDLEPGELVVADCGDAAALGPGRGRITERLGHPDQPRALSLATAVDYGLPLAFAPDIEAAALAARPVALGRRTDLRDLPLITIDGADARDFDDAVLARPDDDPANPEGWQIVVAIADVAHYVGADSPLDQEARRRGNSTYFPDRVLPMLPAGLSNDLCSLRPDEERACVAVHIWLDQHGKMRRHRFCRGLMRSRARLTYDQIQRAADGDPDAATEPLVDPVIRPLYGAFAALLRARQVRGTLDLDLPELGIHLDAAGSPEMIKPRPRHDSHRLIEEFMIAANVAAAVALEQAGWPCMYRVHDQPDPRKLEDLVDLLRHLGLKRSRGVLTKPKDVARLIAEVQEPAIASLVSTLVLRAQAQAVYSPRNLGHYGLNLTRYAHFTSPIRRYADLMVHRALIGALDLGDGGISRPKADPTDDWERLGGQLSQAERRSMAAERTALARFVALFLADRVGAAFAGAVVSVQRFGLFVRLDELLVEGLVPVSALGAEYFGYDRERQVLAGAGSGRAFALGDRVRVELAEADRLTGQLAFKLLDHTPGPGHRGIRRTPGGRRGAGRRPGPVRHRRR